MHKAGGEARWLWLLPLFKREIGDDGLGAGSHFADLFGHDQLFRRCGFLQLLLEVVDFRSALAAALDLLLAVADSTHGG